MFTCRVQSFEPVDNLIHNKNGYENQQLKTKIENKNKEIERVFHRNYKKDRERESNTVNRWRALTELESCQVGSSSWFDLNPKQIPNPRPEFKQNKNPN